MTPTLAAALAAVFVLGSASMALAEDSSGTIYGRYDTRPTPPWVYAQRAYTSRYIALRRHYAPARGYYVRGARYW